MKIDLTDALQCSTSVQVAAHWDAIADSAFNLHKASPIHVELFNFSPSHPIKEYGIDAFKVFLPSSAVEVGDVWQLDSRGCSVPSPVSLGRNDSTTSRRGRCLRVSSRDLVRLRGDSSPNSCGVGSVK